MNTRVLIVDDDFMVARVHAGFVARVDGFDAVGAAGSAADAVAAVTELTPDLVLLDLHLPGAWGLDLVAPMREKVPDLDVLVITSERDAAVVARAMRSGVTGYLIKPFTFDALRDRLEHYRRTRAALRGDADQQVVDAAFGTGPIRLSATALPKGLSEPTLRLVVDALRAVPDGASASEVAAATGVSRASARRYLEHLTTTGRADVRLEYGRVGRPERRYRLG